jgi:hypothetical protein
LAGIFEPHGLARFRKVQAIVVVLLGRARRTADSGRFLDERREVVRDQEGAVRGRVAEQVDVGAERERGPREGPEVVAVREARVTASVESDAGEVEELRARADCRLEPGLIQPLSPPLILWMCAAAR